MVKKIAKDENRTESIEKVDGKRKKREPLPKTEEEIYVESLSKKERKNYEKRKKELRRSQWIAEYWLIIVLGVALLVVATVLVIINQVKGLNLTDCFGRITESVSGLISFIKNA